MTRRSDNGAVEKLSQFLTPQHLRQLKFAGVVTVMTLLCGIFLWYLFTPKPAPQQAGAGGYNVTIPEATVKPAETDKRKVYEQEQYEQQRREKLQSLGDVMDDRLPVTGEMADAIAPAAPTAIDESDAAYRRISGGMAAFYTPAPSCGNTEVEALKEQAIGWDSHWGKPTRVTAAGSRTTGTIRPYGLDCSGFVDWVFNNSLGYVIGHGGGAASQHGHCKPISWSEAQPGDLVFYPGDTHVGVFVGKNSNGDPLIIHCASSQNNVVLTGLQGFVSIGRPDCF